MAALLTIVSFSFLVLETLAGMVANGFIVLINLIDWFRNGKLSLSDVILICLGLSRLLMQAVMIMDVIIFSFHDNSVSNDVFWFTGIVIFSNIVNLWFAACLSVFYLAKIAIFSHPVFLQLKQRFSGMVPWLLLGSVVLSAVWSISLTITWTTGFPACNPYKSLLSNKSDAEMNMPHWCGYITFLLAVIDFIPFMVFLTSCIFLITSLWKHTRRLRCNGTVTGDLNTQVHLTAIKALASFAVLYLLSFAASYSQAALIWHKLHLWTTVLFNLSALYLSGHAMILILINPKLKKSWVRMMHHLKCRLPRVPS